MPEKALPFQCSSWHHSNEQTIQVLHVFLSLLRKWRASTEPLLSFSTRGKTIANQKLCIKKANMVLQSFLVRCDLVCEFERAIIQSQTLPVSPLFQNAGCVVEYLKKEHNSGSTLYHHIYCVWIQTLTWSANKVTNALRLHHQSRFLCSFSLLFLNLCIARIISYFSLAFIYSFPFVFCIDWCFHCYMVTSTLTPTLGKERP